MLKTEIQWSDILKKKNLSKLSKRWNLMSEQAKWIMLYAKQFWGQIIIYTLLGLTGTVVSLLSSLVSKDLVDIVTGHQTGELMTTFLLMIGTQLGSTFLTQTSNYMSTKISLKVENNLKADVFEKIMITDWESISNYHSGDLLVRWNSDVSRISGGLLNLLPNLIIYLFRFFAALYMVLRYDATFAIFSIVSIPLSIGISRLTMRKMQKINMGTMQINSRMSGFNQEAFSNIQTIKAFDLVNTYSRKLKEIQKIYTETHLKYQKISILNTTLLMILSLIVTYSSYGWGIYRVWSGAITYGTMTMFLSLSGTLSGAANNFINLIPSVISISTSTRRLMDLLSMPKEDYSHREEVKQFYEKHCMDGIGLCIEHAKYSYQNGTEVFFNANVEAHPHEIVAFVGPSGEGKTTMLRLVLALIRMQEGQGYICAGNTMPEDGCNMPLTASARQLFSYVPQGNSLLSGTIADNLRNVKEDATDEEICEALRLAGALDFVEKLPDGINSVIKERGGGFSEGQAQRLAIARALIRKSPILLLDEATSALDVALERQVLRNIMQDEYPRTTIVTTHRPTVLNMCDRVYSIRNKECVVLSRDEIQQMIRDF